MDDRESPEDRELRDAVHAIQQADVHSKPLPRGSRWGRGEGPSPLAIVMGISVVVGIIALIYVTTQTLTPP